MCQDILRASNWDVSRAVSKLYESGMSGGVSTPPPAVAPPQLKKTVSVLGDGQHILNGVSFENFPLKLDDAIFQLPDLSEAGDNRESILKSIVDRATEKDLEDQGLINCRNCFYVSLRRVLFSE